VVIVWNGSGSLVLLSLIILSFIFNVDIYLNYTSQRFKDMNWWIPFLLNAPITFYWSQFCQKMNTYQGENIWLSNLFLYWGKKHTLFFIDIKIWAFLFFFIGLYIKFH
jgi:hypothetical protein